MKSKELNEFADIGWIQRWSGSYTFISCSYWGPQYFNSLKNILGVNFAHTLFVHKKGTVDFYVAREELDNLGKTLANQVKRNPKLVGKYSKLIKDNTDILVQLMSNSSIPSTREYKEFLTVFDRHLAYHGFIKETVDYLDSDSLNKLLPDFEEARKYSERIYSDSEIYFRNLSRVIAKKENRNSDLLTCLTQLEFEEYLEDKNLPEDKILEKRYRKSALYFSNSEAFYLFDKDVDNLEKAIVDSNSVGKEDIKGIPAFPGVVKGICRIVPDPNNYKRFNKKDILITGMTRPEFLHLVSLCSAIVTDSGGILSHAAITAREFKKPCIVGTGVATKVFKDGDMVEVDANKGIVRKIK